MELFYVILILLLLSRAFGELAERMGQPSLVGELLAGVALGVAIMQLGDRLPTLAGLTEDEVFISLTDLGMFFLMLLAGVEMHPEQIIKASGKAFVVAIGGMLVPLGLGVGLGLLFLPESDLRGAQAFFIGVAMAITAVPVAVKMLMDLGKLDTPFGQVVVSAALFDDVLSLVLLAVLTALIRTGGFPGTTELLLLLGKVGLFFAIALVAWRLFDPLIGRLFRKVRAPEVEFSGLLVLAFGLAVLAETLSMHFIIGAFIAGLLFGRKTIDEKTYGDVKLKLSGLTTGFLAPLFFVSIGLSLDPRAIWQVPVFVGLLVGLAFVGKVVGSAIPAGLVGLGRRAALALGFAMAARGAVELIVAEVALRGGLFESPEDSEIVGNLFSAVVIMAIVTTLATPIFLRWLAPEEERP